MEISGRLGAPPSVAIENVCEKEKNYEKNRINDRRK